jgi:Tfp pilus assembly protein PilF
MVLLLVGAMLASPAASAQSRRTKAPAKPFRAAGKSQGQPGSPRLKQANLMAARGDYEGAVARYEEVLKSEPGNASAYHMYGRTLALKGDLPGAIAKYREAVRLSPGNVELRNDLGVALCAHAEYDAAIEELKKAIAMSPKYVPAHNNLGVTLMRAGDYKGAAEAFRTSLKLQPQNKIVQKKLAEALKYQSEPAAPPADQ